MSDTPRTDSVMTTCGSLHNERVVVGVEFARTLERELAAERAKVARLRKALQGMLDPALLGALTDEEVILDFGAIGLSHVNFARAALNDTDG